MLEERSLAIIGTRGYPSYYGGFETAVRKLAPFLASRGWRVTVYGRPGETKPNDTSHDTTVASVITRGIKSKSFSTLSYGLTASIHAARAKPDVALVMNVANGFFLPFLKLRGIKTVVNVDGIEWDRQKWGRIAKLAFRAGALFTAKFADELIFDSRVIESRWASEFGRHGHFIPYGGEEAAAVPPEQGLSPGGYVLLVARFVPENTIAEFFDAAATIALQYPVVLVGSSGYGGEFDDRALSLSRTHSQVHWLGHISDDARLFGLWANAGIYFHGHSVGGTNPTLVQAMALGCCIVARDTPYNREVLGHGGIYCEPNADSIASVTVSTMQDKHLLISSSRSNRLRATETYTWDIVNAAYAKLLNGMAALK